MVRGTRSNPAKDDAASEAAGVEAPAMPAQEAEVTGGSEVEGVRVGAEGSPSRADREEVREVGAEGSPSRADTVEVRMAGAGGSLATSDGGRRDGNRMILGALADITNTLQGMGRQVADQSDIINTLQQRMTAMEADGNAEHADWKLTRIGNMRAWIRMGPEQNGRKVEANLYPTMRATWTHRSVPKIQCKSIRVAPSITNTHVGIMTVTAPVASVIKTQSMKLTPSKWPTKSTRRRSRHRDARISGTARSLTLDVRGTGC